LDDKDDDLSRSYNKKGDFSKNDIDKVESKTGRVK
jgi:hypothetical protein